jgi:hypothetical protein
MNRASFTKASVVLLAGVIAMSGCSSSDGETSDSDANTTEAASSDSGSSLGSETEADESSGGEYSADDGGSGSLTVDGIENAGFLGECEISRENGAEDVGDVSTEGIEVILAIDNVESSPTEEMNFIVTGTPETFRAVGVGDGAGTVDSIAYVGDQSALGDDTEIGLVAFSGTTDDGTSVVAEVVCVTQNAYS